MRFMLSTLALAMIATASVIPTEAKFSEHHPTVIAQCEEAPNCETYDTDRGVMMRFVKGMEPGTADYESRFLNTTEHQAIVKRNTQTHVTFGSTSINYGTTNPSDAIHMCGFNYCHEGSCDTSQCTAGTSDLVRQGRSLGPRGRTLTLTSDGQYNGWAERDNYVNAMVIASSKGQKWTQHDWCIYTNEGDDCGTQWWGQQTTFVGVNKFYNGNLQGFISIKVSMDAEDANWCSGLDGVAGAVAGAVSPIAGAFFGFVSLLC